MRDFIEGYDELEKKLGYEPDFREDHIEKIIIISDRIEVELKTVDGVFYSVIFEDAKHIALKGKIMGLLGIMSGLEIERIDDKLKTTIGQSMGLYGEIVSKRIIVK